MPLGQPIKVLIVDDDRLVIAALTKLLACEPVVIETEPDAIVTAGQLESGHSPWDVVILDVDMPGIRGPELLDKFRESGSLSSVIMLSGDVTATTAAACMRAGAFHYLTKPFRAIELVEVVHSAARHSRMRRELTGERAAVPLAHSSIIGTSRAMCQLRASIERLALQNVSVLIQGESGTGKELVARLIHDRSPRHDHTFVAVNCGAIPDTLIDTELFGHRKGAFTGATTDRSGLFVEADGGTLFLDEIGDMPFAVQARLLRVLQEGEVRAVGGSGVRNVDVRVLAATHVDLVQAVERGLFRKDLFYRLNVVVLEIPPLRARLDDLPILAARFLHKHGGDAELSLSGAALDALASYAWPGNVRELENAVISAIAMRTGPIIGAESLPAHISARARGSSPIPLTVTMFEGDPPPTLAEAKRRVSAQFERDYLTRALRRANGSVAEAARIAGVDRTNFRRLLQRYELDPGTFK